MGNFTRPRRYRAKIQATTKRRAPLNPVQKKQVKKLIINSGETYHHDVTVAYGTDVGTTTNFTDLTNISQGDGDGERLGDRLRPKSLKIQLYANGGGASATSSTIGLMRIMVIRWKPDTANQALTSNTQILETADANSLLLRDETERRKFSVLWDKTFRLSGDSANTQHHLQISKWLKLAKTPVIYNEGLTTGSNKLYVLVVGTSLSANTVEYGGTYRLMYKEK